MSKMPLNKIKKYKLRLINALLRLAPMAAKLALTLYMVRYFTFAEIGTYGLVVGAVTMLTVIIGQDLIYVVSRDIVGDDSATVLHKMRDQAIHYVLNYFVLIVFIVGLNVTHGIDVPQWILIYVVILTVLESLGTVTYYNLISLQHQVWANALFFIRSGFWVLPVVALCTLNPAFRTANIILAGWIFGAAANLVFTLWYWRDMPWREVMLRPVNWAWLKQGIKLGCPIWLGMMGLTAGTFFDRFVVQYYLTIEDVGVLTFYFSFANALLALMQSGIGAFTTPRLIQHHRDGAAAEFHNEAKQAWKQIAIGAGGMALGLGIVIPLLGYSLGRPVLVTSAGVFWMMMFATWLRANADMLNYMLYARHQDRAVWMGNLLFLIPALGGNILLVPLLGFPGVGYSSIVAAAFLYTWRWQHMRRYTTTNTKTP